MSNTPDVAAEERGAAALKRKLHLLEAELEAEQAGEQDAAQTADVDGTDHGAPGNHVVNVYGADVRCFPVTLSTWAARPPRAGCVCRSREGLSITSRSTYENNRTLV